MNKFLIALICGVISCLVWFIERKYIEKETVFDKKTGIRIFILGFGISFLTIMLIDSPFITGGGASDINIINSANLSLNTGVPSF